MCRLITGGSGTRNRTLILLALFRAKQISETPQSASKTTPLLIIEEPESFLHPSAQAEFGKVLQDLSEEFGVQVIVTTHSPFMLSVSSPAANVLLCRKEHYHQPRETQRTDTTGQHWMVPFSEALGLVDDELKPWTDLLLNQSDAILLVEGETDKEYFEMLRSADHGSHRLAFDGEIVSYEGTGSLSNTVLFRFIKNRHKKLFVSFDLDAEQHVAKTLAALGLEKGQHYAPVGVNAAGKRSIEGLLPDNVRLAVFNAHADLVQAAMNGTTEEKKAAWKDLKKHYLNEFKKQAKPTAEFFGQFYSVVKLANKALN